MERRSADGVGNRMVGAHLRRGLGSACHGQRVPDRAWNWVGMHLDNGWDVAAWSQELIDISTQDKRMVQMLAVGSAPTGEEVHSTVVLSGSNPWTSLSTLNSYQTRWEIHAPELDLLATADACFPDQEIESMAFPPGHLEACARVHGTMAGQPIHGRAFITVMPSQRIGDFEGFLRRLNTATEREVKALYPDQPTEDVCQRGHSHGRSWTDTAPFSPIHRYHTEHWKQSVAAHALYVPDGKSSLHRGYDRPSRIGRRRLSPGERKRHA